MKKGNKLNLNLIKPTNSLLVYKKYRGRESSHVKLQGSKHIDVEYETAGPVCFKKRGRVWSNCKNKMQCTVYLWIIIQIKQMGNNIFETTDKL